MKKKILSENHKNYLDAVVEHVAHSIADKTAKTTVALAFQTAVEKRDKDKRKLFQEAENMLRAKETLEENVIENEEKLKNIEIGINNKTKASDIVCMAQNRLTEEQMIEGRIISLKAKIEKDSAILEQIKGAINKVKHDKWYKIIELKYWEDWEDEDIAEEFQCDIRTIRRHKSSLVRKIATKIYGSEFVGG